MRAENGFTLFELFIVIAVTALLSTIAVNRFTVYSAHTRLETTAPSVFKDISTARILALKHDAAVKVSFSNSGYEIFIDENGDGDYQSAEMIQTYTLTSPLQFGLPSEPPSSNPPDATLPESGECAGGDWAEAGLVVANNALGTVNAGSVYISSQNLPKVTFCLRVSGDKQNLKMLKWNGTSWIAL